MGKYQYKLIKISNTSNVFVKELKSAFESLDIKSYICRKISRNKIGYEVVIRKKDSFNKFMKIIKPKNNKGKINGDAGI